MYLNSQCMQIYTFQGWIYDIMKKIWSGDITSKALSQHIRRKGTTISLGAQVQKLQLISWGEFLTIYKQG